jgi:sialate O-acetylesterase
VIANEFVKPQGTLGSSKPLAAANQFLLSLDWRANLEDEISRSDRYKVKMKIIKLNQRVKLTVLLPVFLAVASYASAELELPAIFGDNMVLQQQMRVPVWGWSNPGATVKVTFAGQIQSTRADAHGKWRVQLDPLQASAKSESMVLESGKTLILTNILVGEVWLASGQSNMEMPIGGNEQPFRPVFNAADELAAANYPEIRIFKVEKKLAAAPLTDLAMFHGWQECKSNTLNTTRFSAVAYFFGRGIYTNLNVPVGLVESAWGGTRIEPWTPSEGFQMVSSLAKFAQEKINSQHMSNYRPMAIYNAMIAPLAGFAMRGVIWYQGESNLIGGPNNYDYLTYADKMVALVEGWRSVWHEGEFPFYFVQIAPFKYNISSKQRTPTPESEAEFWTLQSLAARRIKHSGMVVTTDLVDNLRSIHPLDKQDVGHRLALLARAKTYGEDVVCSGPIFTWAKFADDKAILHFSHVDGGLKSRDSKPLNWFSIAGSNGKFVSAQAEIAGDTVEVFSPKVNDPKAVRFAWDETAQPNLSNAAGLPAEPFRTDESK